MTIMLDASLAALELCSRRGSQVGVHVLVHGIRI